MKCKTGAGGAVGQVMLLIIFELILLYILIRRQWAVHRKFLLFAAFLMQFTLLFIYRLELKFLWGREVYWSDAEYYWNATLELLKYGKVTAHNILYVYYGWLLQITSPFVGVIWNNISNVLLLNLSFLLAVETSRNLKNHYRFSRIRNDTALLPFSLYFLTIVNPLVVYSLMRNLKDSLFLFLVSFSVFLIKQIAKIKSLLWLTLAVALYNVLLIPLLTNIRPWGFAIPVVNMISLLISKESMTRGRKFAISLGFLALSVFVFFQFIQRIQGWISRRDLLLELGAGLENKGVLPTVLGVFRLLIGPGPIRSLFGSDFFQFYTYLGNFSSLLGSTIFWFIFPYFLTRYIPQITRLLRNGSAFFLNLVAILSIYAYFYGGSAELRFRGVIYSLIAFFILETIPEKKHFSDLDAVKCSRGLRNQMMAYAVVGIFMVSAGLYFSK